MNIIVLHRILYCIPYHILEVNMGVQFLKWSMRSLRIRKCSNQQRYWIGSTAVSQIRKWNLIKEEQASLERVLAMYRTIFDGKLDCHPHNKIKLDIPQDSQPVRKHPYPIPFRQEHTFIKKMVEMVNNEILWKKHGGSERTSLTFVVPKKDNRIRIVSDFREVNMLIKRKPYPMPRIHKIMQKRSGYTHFTKMDLSMQF